MTDLNTQTNDPSSHDGSNVQAFFERTVVAALRFCGQAVYMFRFLLSPPSLLAKRIAAHDTRLAPPLSFLTVGVFVAGMVQRLAYAIDPGESYTAAAFTTEFHESYSQISLWEVSLRTFPGVVLVVLIGVIAARLAKSSQPFDRSPIVATACYAAGLHALVVGLLYFMIMWINAFHSTEIGSAIGQSTKERLLTGAVGLTGLYGVLAMAESIRIATERKWMPRFRLHFPIGTLATVLLLSVIYMTVEVSFDTGSADLRRHTRWEQGRQDGFRVSLVESESQPDRGNQLTQLHATLALTNVSNEKILVPRHRQLVTADDQTTLNVFTNSIDLSEDNALIIEPNQTRVVHLGIDMRPVRMKLVAGEISQRVLFPFHKAQNGYSYIERDHYLTLPLPTYGHAGGGIGLPPGIEIGRRPANGFGDLLRK